MKDEVYITLDGREFIEVPETMACKGCLFRKDANAECTKPRQVTFDTLHNLLGCSKRKAIFVLKETNNANSN